MATPTPSPVIDCTKMAGGCEGDINRVDPRVPGYGDNKLDGDDLIWYDIFANGFMCTEIAPNEFQRMDVAPTSTKGDGALGLDRNEIETMIATSARISAGGPFTSMTPLCNIIGGTADGSSASSQPFTRASSPLDFRPVPTDLNAVRSLRIGSVMGRINSAIAIPVEADLGGGEAMVQFTLHFDPSHLKLGDGDLKSVITLAETLPEGTRIILNTSRLDTGDLGVIVYLNGSGSMPPVTADAGTTTLLTIDFQITDEAKIASVTPLTFTNDVFDIKISDPFGQGLQVNGSLQAGAVTLADKRR